MMKENDTDESREQYHNTFRACRILIRQSKRDYEKRIARETKSNPKKNISFNTYEKKSKSNIGLQKDESGTLT